MKRRCVVCVDRLESRDTPSAAALSAAVVATPALIQIVEDPNQRPSDLTIGQEAVRAFNPQPDPPSRASLIIAI